jgi:ribitol 2-dehydrogenase
MSTISLANKVAVISGGSSGIGLAMAKALDTNGVQVVLIGNDENQINSVTKEFAKTPLNIVGDISDSKVSDEAISQALKKFGSVDIVIANAGIYLTKDGWSVPGKQIDEVIGVNIAGVMHLTHAAINHFLKVGGGDIVVTSSVAGLVDVPHEAVYSATKHAVTSFVNSTRHRLAGKNIRIGSIEPGIVQTPLWVTKSESTGVAVPDIVKEDRALKPDDIAAGVLFMLTQPRHVNIRDVVMLPTDQPF